jgi:FkbM family methyltransferase
MLIMFVRLIKAVLAAIGFEIHRTGGMDLTHQAFFRKQIHESTRGILHIGGHRGQEAPDYARAKVNVLWIEALENAFKELEIVIKDFPDQQALNALLGDRDEIVSFHVASNEGMSSSIFGFAQGNGYGLSMTQTVKLEMKRLDRLLSAEQVRKYPHWVVDVQGAELSVLRGAGRLLDYCNTLDVEVSTFEVYEGGVSFVELDKFLREEGFIPLWQPKLRTHQDLLYVRARSHTPESSATSS